LTALIGFVEQSRLGPRVFLAKLKIRLNVTIGQCVADLELIAKGYEPEDMVNRFEYLPL
jgi:hypothetical protein